MIQRVCRAAVEVDQQVVGEIGGGLLVLLGVAPSDGGGEIDWLARKLVGLRIFEDEAGKMDHSLLDVGGDALVVSQFTLYGDVRKGRRPSFVGAARPEHAEQAYEAFCGALETLGVPIVARGQFGAHMAVSLVNDGPVTLILDTP